MMCWHVGTNFIILQCVSNTFIVHDTFLYHQVATTAGLVSAVHTALVQYSDAARNSSANKTIKPYYLKLFKFKF